MVNSIARAKTGDNAPDAAAWVWMKEMIENLGYEGMSSDESEVEQEEGEVEDEEALLSRANFAYRVKRMPWRKDITNELDIIDSERLKDRGTYRRQGSKPVPRRRDPNAPSTSRQAVPGLPIAFYNDTWYAKLSEDRKNELFVSDRKFNWFNVTVGK